METTTYKGQEYDIHPDDGDGWDYILFKRKKLFLNKKGMVLKKQPGIKSEVYPFTIEDCRKMLKYFKDSKMWQSYLWFVIGCNLGRRAEDTRSLKWRDLFEKNGHFKKQVSIKEEKTGKCTMTIINSAIRDAVRLYCNELDISPLEEYDENVFLNRSGTYKGMVYTVKSYGESIKKAARELGITYNVNTHSTRKFLGKTLIDLHPNDPRALMIVSKIFAHSSLEQTMDYVGITGEKIEHYFEDMGDFFCKYAEGDAEYVKQDDSSVINIDAEKLRSVITEAYYLGMNNADSNDTKTHTDAISSLITTAIKNN